MSITGENDALDLHQATQTSPKLDSGPTKLSFQFHISTNKQDSHLDIHSHNFMGTVRASKYIIEYKLIQSTKPIQYLD